ncbi:hypothetical protein B0H67DRAFT_674184 [Lasiosphaeris hirsuta]|uniref:Uncharacterized protein n=1 Tax=Lasiosphaeris hirsuta TaxID=260670 RepID=A0AA39ZW91_9PEZI|nr:hypothetical protein B0H67DRAFT_674184 [Lasiosphaeris hirsuta]
MDWMTRDQRTEAKHTNSEDDNNARQLPPVSTSSSPGPRRWRPPISELETRAAVTDTAPQRWHGQPGAQHTSTQSNSSLPAPLPPGRDNRIVRSPRYTGRLGRGSLGDPMPWVAQLGSAEFSSAQNTDRIWSHPQSRAPPPVHLPPPKPSAPAWPTPPYQSYPIHTPPTLAPSFSAGPVWNSSTPAPAPPNAGGIFQELADARRELARLNGAFAQMRVRVNEIRGVAGQMGEHLAFVMAAVEDSATARAGQPSNTPSELERLLRRVDRLEQAVHVLMLDRHRQTKDNDFRVSLERQEVKGPFSGDVGSASNFSRPPSGGRVFFKAPSSKASSETKWIPPNVKNDDGSEVDPLDKSYQVRKSTAENNDGSTTGEERIEGKNKVDAEIKGL